MEFNWNLWAEYSQLTQQEKKWGLEIGKELYKRKILPCPFVLDVGCNTGEFIRSLNVFTPHVEGIDEVDVRTNKNFYFHFDKFENYNGNYPTVLIFKQSFHLIENQKEILNKYNNSFIIIAQMPKPFWDDSENWNRIENVANLLKENNREVEILNLELHHKIKKTFLKKMFIEGYTSDLQKKTSTERKTIWKKIKSNFKEKKLFSDKIDWVISTPSNYKRTIQEELLWLLNLK